MKISLSARKRPPCLSLSRQNQNLNRRRRHLRDIDAELTAKCGPAFYLTKKGAVVINESYFVQRICRENLVFFEYDENRFFRYNAENGAWEAVAPGIIKELVRSEWERLTRLFNEPASPLKITTGLINALQPALNHIPGATRSSND